MAWTKIPKTTIYTPLIKLLTHDLKDILVGSSESEILVIQRENDSWTKTVKNSSSWTKTVKPTI